MNALLLAVTFIAVVNPLRTRLGLPESEGRVRPVPLLSGAVIAFGAVVLLAWVSGPLLDALEITPEYSLTAAGVVAIAGGLFVFFFPTPHDEPVPDGPASLVWPVAFPRLFSPEMAMLALAIASTQGVVDVAWPTALGVGLTVLLALVPVGEAGRGLLRWSGRILASAVVFGGIWLIIEGIRAV
jgi:hypothetical protein